MEKKQLTLVVVSLLVVVLSVSVAYFTAQIIGEGKNVSVTSANLQIVFEDTDGSIANSSIEPGWTSTKTFTVTNNSKSEYKYNIVLKDLVNTFVTNGYLQYKITSTNSGYNMTEFKNIPKSDSTRDEVLAYNISIPMNISQEYTITFQYLNDEDIDQSDDMGMKLSGSLFITEGTTPPPTLYEQLLADKTERPGARTDFSTVLTEDNTKTLYTSTENDNTVYYFAGNATDNWAKFGTYPSDLVRGYGTSRFGSEYADYNSIEECEIGTYMSVSKSYDLNQNCTYLHHSGDPIYWRIIRTNADGGIRLLYHGTSHDSTEAYIGTTSFNSTSGDSMYVGYMYGTSGTLESNRTNENNSTIKLKIDSWYESNLKTNYGKYLSETAVYCNDREVSEGTYSTNGSIFYYKGYTRLITNKTPTYDCTNTRDAFSVNNTSAKLDYPIGLMTADEVALAGGLYVNDAPAYYYRNSSATSISSTSSKYWWTLTPSRWNGTGSKGYVIGGSENIGWISGDYVNIFHAVRPVISLKSCVKWSTGDGTPESSYEIIYDDAC